METRELTPYDKIRHALLDLLEDIHKMTDAIEEGKDNLLKADGAVPTVKTITANDIEFKVYECGACQKEFQMSYKYCPHCGRKVLTKYV